MYTGPGRFTRLWRKVRDIPVAVQGAAVVAVIVLAAVGAARSHDGSSGPDQILSPASSAPSTDQTPSPEPTHSGFASSDDTPLVNDATASPSASASPSDSASPSSTESPSPSATSTATSTSFMYSDCKEIKAAGRDPLSRGEYGYNPELDKDHDGVDCH